jgi:hypothetical protein
MRNVLLAILGLMLACLTQASAAVHGLAGDNFNQNPMLVSDGSFAAPVSCGLCREDYDCALRTTDVPMRTLRNIGRYAAPLPILEVIDAASEITKVDFDYLLRTAALESSFNPLLQANTSSAAGLYQFVEQSWFHMVQETGAELGLEDLAVAIGVGEGGSYHVTADEAREEILRLRYDPELSAIFAGLFTRRNFEALARRLERDPDPGELYLAHVLGASGAAELIRLVAVKPAAKAAAYFRRAARANRTIFYHEGRKPRSVAEVYEYLTGKYRNIPVEADAAPIASERPHWQPPLPGWRMGGDEVPYAMR